MKYRVDYIKKKYKDKVYSYPFLVSSYRDEKGTPQRKIIQKLSHLPDFAVEALRDALKRGETSHLVDIEQIHYDHSLPFGDTWAVWSLLQQMGVIEALRSLPQKHQHVIVASIIDRVINPKPLSKRALCDAFETSILKRILEQEESICLSEWYNALDTLYANQVEIQKELFTHSTGIIYLYDITSAYVEGNCCPLAEWGYNRDGKKGKKIIVVGLLTDMSGRPLAIIVFEGNTNDQTTVLDQIDEMRNEYSIDEMVFVGDRGMITSKRIEELEEEEYSWVRYITALKRKDLMTFIEQDDHPIQLSLFDHRNLVEVSEGGRRYVLCHNPLRSDEDKQTRLRLLSKTEEKLHSIKQNVVAGRLKNKDKIAKRLYRWINKWKMERFFNVSYAEGYFDYSRNEEEIARYAILDGCYVVTSNVDKQQLNTSEVHARYKDLKYVESAFRTMKVSDIFIRPVRHWKPTRVRGHVFMCMLAYLVIWESKKRLSPLLERDPQNRECEGKSLREIWKTLSDLSIGQVVIEDTIYEQIGSVTKQQREILKLLNVPINGEAQKVCRKEKSG